MGPSPTLSVSNLGLCHVIEGGPIKLVSESNLTPSPGSGRPGHVSTLATLFGSADITKPPSPHPSSASKTTAPHTATPRLPTEPTEPTRTPLVAPTAGTTTPNHPPPVGLPATSLSTQILPTCTDNCIRINARSLVISGANDVIIFEKSSHPSRIVHGTNKFCPHSGENDTVRRSFEQTMRASNLGTRTRRRIETLGPKCISANLSRSSKKCNSAENFLCQVRVPSLRRENIGSRALKLSSPCDFAPGGRLSAQFFVGTDALRRTALTSVVPPEARRVAFVAPVPGTCVITCQTTGDDR